jgi:hypothetical protein
MARPLKPGTLRTKTWPGVKPDDKHAPETTRYQNRTDFVPPPEAQAVIDKMWPHIERAFKQYGASEGMLAVYVATRDATKAAGWGDDKAHLMRDYILGMVNKAKFKPNFGSDPEFQVESAERIVNRLLEA